jgi:hypothetical protein
MDLEYQTRSNFTGLVASAEPFSLLLSFLVLSYRTLAVEFSMRWIRRTNRRWSTWLALAAMALQLVLSFGHIHLEKLASGSVIASVTTSDAPSSQQNPAQHPANEADNFCAICATIHLASSSFLPDAPLLQVPFASRTIEHFGNFNFIFVSPQRAAFQSRAPPLA